MYTPEDPPSQVLPPEILEKLYKGSSLEELICANSYDFALTVDRELERKAVRDVLGDETYALLYDGARLIFALIRELDEDARPFPAGDEPPATRPMFDATTP